MAAPVLPEKRAEIIAAVKAGAVTVPAAATQYGVTAETIRKWIRKKIDNAASSGSEVLRLRREVQLLKEICAGFLLEKELAKKNGAVR